MYSSSRNKNTTAIDPSQNKVSIEQRIISTYIFIFNIQNKSTQNLVLYIILRKKNS